MKIQKMSLEEKIAMLSETQKAYVLGYIDKALLENKPRKKTGKTINGKTQNDEEDEAQYEHEEGRYDGEV